MLTQMLTKGSCGQSSPEALAVSDGLTSGDQADDVSRAEDNRGSASCWGALTQPPDAGAPTGRLTSGLLPALLRTSGRSRRRVKSV